MSGAGNKLSPDAGRLSSAIRAGKAVAGPFLKIPAAAVTEAFAVAGFDFVIIDLEHGPFSIETAETITRAARLSGISPVVRVAHNESSAISRALDIGIDGLIIPHISTAEDAVDSVHAARFHPVGERGMDMFARAASWGAVEKSDYMSFANRETLLCVMVEGAEGLSNLDKIAGVAGIDVIFVGPYDLSQSLGIPGQVRSEEVDRAIRSALAAAKGHGLGLGLYVDDVEAADYYRSMGVQFIALSADVSILTQSARALRQALDASESAPAQ